MFRSGKFIYLLFFFLSASCTAGDARNVSLLGAWKCGPYAMAGERFDITAMETSTYLTDGSYRATSELTVRLAGGKVVKTRDRSYGSWTLKNDIIEIRYNKVEFLSSDDPAYTTEMGQADSDAQQKKKNWAKYKILELNDKLILLPVESMYKAAEVTVTCVRT
jgi:hypothetical protein